MSELDRLPQPTPTNLPEAIHLFTDCHPDKIRQLIAENEQPSPFQDYCNFCREEQLAFQSGDHEKVQTMFRIGGDRCRQLLAVVTALGYTEGDVMAAEFVVHGKAVLPTDAAQTSVIR